MGLEIVPDVYVLAKQHLLFPLNLIRLVSVPPANFGVLGLFWSGPGAWAWFSFCSLFFWSWSLSLLPLWSFFSSLWPSLSLWLALVVVVVVLVVVVMVL